MSLTIDRVASKRQKNEFLHYPFKKYRDDPLWAPPFLMSEKQRLDTRKNPFFKHARIEFFLARQGDEVVGRIAAFVDDVHNDRHGEKTAFFGLFDADTREVATALWDAAEKWGREAGMNHLRGPVSLTMEEGVGFQLDNFTDPPYVLMHYNWPEYIEWVEAAGYEKLKDFYCWKYYAEPKGKARLIKIANRMFKRMEGRLRVRNMNPWKFKSEMRILFDLYNQAWGDNWGFRPKTEEEFMFMVKDLRMIMVSTFTTVVELDGKPVGAMLSLPDSNELMRRIGGRLLPFGWWHFLRRNSIYTRARMSIMGVLGEWRNKGLESILISEPMKHFDSTGYSEGECSWVLEDNDKANKVIVMSGCSLHKTYRLYHKKL